MTQVLPTAAEGLQPQEQQQGKEGLELDIAGPDGSASTAAAANEAGRYIPDEGTPVATPSSVDAPAAPHEEQQEQRGLDPVTASPPLLATSSMPATADTTDTQEVEVVMVVAEVAASAHSSTNGSANMQPPEQQQEQGAGAAPPAAAPSVEQEEHSGAAAEHNCGVSVTAAEQLSSLGSSPRADAAAGRAGGGGGGDGGGGGGAASANGDSSEDDLDASYDIRETDHFGFFLTSDRAGPAAVQGPESAVLLAKEEERARKWMAMGQKWGNVVGTRLGRRTLRRRARKGIPDAVRAQAWQLLSGSKARMAENPGQYAALLASDLKVEGPIEEDIPRTMFDHEMFCKHSRMHGHSKLRHVLLAFGRFDRDVQYCQGINYIAALFLLYMPEEEAFWTLVCVMQRQAAPLRELFLPGMRKAREFHFVMDSLLKKFCPRLHRHMRSNDIEPAIYAHPWFMTCFTQSFPYELCTRVWDVFLEEDWKIMYRVCLALFKHVEPQVCALDLEHGNTLMRKLPASVDGEAIMHLAMNLPLKHRHIAKRMRQFHVTAARSSRNLSQPQHR